MRELGFDIQNVDDHRGNSSHTLISGCADKPGCPAALGCTRNHKAVQRWHRFLLRQCLDCVHSLDHSLRHREVKRPRFITRLNKLDPGVRNQRIFVETIVERLVWDIVDDGKRGTGACSNRQRDQVVFLAAASTRIQHRAVARTLDFLRDEQLDAVVPLDVLPYLGCHLHVVDGSRWQVALLGQ